MALPQHVVWRGQRLQYRRAYPKELWALTGPGASFVISLRTSDPREAHRARPEAERRFNAKVDALRLELAQKVYSVPLTKAAAEAIAVRWFLAALETASDLRVPRSGDALDKAIEDAEWAAAEARRALAEGELADKHRLARCLREAARFSSEPLADAYLVELLARATVALNEVHAGRLVGDYGARPRRDPFFAATLEASMQPRREPALLFQPSQEAVPVGGPQRTVADLVDTFKRGRLPQLAPTTQLAYEPIFRLLEEALGRDRQLGSITEGDGLELFELVKREPVNARKLPALRALGYLEAIGEGERLGLPTLNPKTINDGRMSRLSAFFKEAVKRGWMARNPVEGLRVRDEVADKDRREPFGAARLATVFEASPWSPQDLSGGGKAIRYWGPLLALYQGLRLAEVAGLRVQDVVEEGGTPLLYIRAHARPLKSASARRDLPVHPELVRLGFLDFAARRREAAEGTELLFAGERAGAKGQWGRRLGEWFAAKVRQLGVTGTKLTFHALRHDFRDALREADVDKERADYLMGHAGDGGAGAGYGASRPPLARLTEAMNRVAFPSLHPPAAP